ncbi:MAG: ferric reductase-like transmembrane domain-containing protein [Phycisphaerales bacterium]
MSHRYIAVQWNRHKRRYDIGIVAAVLAFLITFVVVATMQATPETQLSPPILLIRAFGIAAFTLLHVVLAIGPLARLTPRAEALRYNRRHLGVTVFVLGLLHALASIGFYGAFGDRNPISALLAGYSSFGSLSGFPFEWLGFLALIILFLLAATSHDFWLATLGPRGWKRLHGLVYVAYVLLVGHIVLGALQTERWSGYPIMLAVGGVFLATLHIAAAGKQRGIERREREAATSSDEDGWIDAGQATDIPDDGAVTIRPPVGGAIAVFRHKGCVSAVANQCAHQGGPLGEGRIIDGCITCPWHGYQYRPADGQSPPPYEEKLPTHDVRVQNGRVQIRIQPNLSGTAVTPAPIDGSGGSGGSGGSDGSGEPDGAGEPDGSSASTATNASDSSQSSPPSEAGQ